MTRIKIIETALADAIKEAREEAPHRLVTIIVPNPVAGLQWRRRVARASGALFNVRWIDVNQFAQEVITQSGSSLRPATQLVQVAAAWKVLQQAPSEYRLFQDSPEMPFQMVRAFDTVDSLEREEREALQPAVREMFEAYGAVLEERDRYCEILSKAAAILESSGLPQTGAFVFMSSSSLSSAQRRFAAALGGCVTTISMDFSELPPIRSISVHDETDEVQWVIAQIQDAALEEGIPVHDMAVIIPGRNPYGKLFDSSADAAHLNWNGLGVQTMGESIPGQLLATHKIEDGLSWPDAISAISKVVESPGVVSQLVKDEIESWTQIVDIVPVASRSLVSALVSGLLSKPIACPRGFGDGVFVGTHRHLEGLSFERVFVLGFNDSSYPPKSRPIPLLPIGMGVPSVSDQKKYFLGNLNPSNLVVLSYARSDRRAGSESFPSPWLLEFAGPGTPSLASSLQLLASCGPRSEAALAVAAGLAVGIPHSKVKETLSRWNAGDVLSEAGVGVSLQPTTPLSPTQIETFLKCPRKWYFKYVVGIQEPEVRPPFGFSPAEVGTMIHETLAQLFDAHTDDLRDPSYRWTSEHSAQVAESLLLKAALLKGNKLLRFEEDDIHRWGRRLDRVLEYDCYYRGEKSAVPILLEKPLYGQIQGVPFQGKADRIDRLRDGSLSIIDYKTGKNKSGAPFELTSKKLEQDPTAGGSTLQGLIYADLARQDPGIAQGSAFKAGYWFFGREPEKMEATQVLDVSSQTCLESTVSAVRSMMEDGLVPMTPEKEGQSGLCGYCPYTQICPGERSAIASRQKSRAEGPYLKFLELKTGNPQEQEAGNE